MSTSSVLNLASPVFRHARTNPDRTAVVVDDRTYTYAQLAGAAGRVASWLLSRVNRTDGRAPRVGVLAARSFETYAGILGAAWAGGTYIALNRKQPAARINYVIEKAGIDALIVDEKSLSRLGELGDGAPKHAIAGDVWKEVAALPEPPAPLAVAPDHPAYILFTSGTTGVPKGVIITAANIAHFIACTRALYAIGPNDRVAQFFEITFDPSGCEMHGCWDAGAALHTVPETKVMAPGGFFKQHEITHLQAVPSLILMMKKTGQLEPNSYPCLRNATFGGEGAPVEAFKAFQAAAPNCVLENMYGPTEATVGCVSHLFTSESVETPGRGTLSIGKPMPGTAAAILGPKMNFLAAGQIGELALYGPQLALGYLGDDDMTARRFVTLDHPRLGRSRWYLSGDSAFCDERGFFHHLGRIDNQVKVMGHRVELEEIEAHLRAVCKTEAVAAVAWPLVNGNASGIVAFVSGGQLGAAEVREEMKRRVPPYMIPGKVHAMDALPLSTNGKVDRNGLKSMLDQKVIA